MHRSKSADAPALLNDLEADQQFMSISSNTSTWKSESSQGMTFLAGGGVMGSLIRAHDWTSTLGPPEAWSAPLRTAVQAMLSTAHPSFLFWGPRHICLYNDGYAPFVGTERHPSMLGAPGREMWKEIWDTVSPDLHQAMSGKSSVWREDFCIPLVRSGKVEELYWTFSYSPVPDPTAPSGVGGAMVITTQTTNKVIKIKVQDFRLRLEAQLRKLADTDEIFHTGTRMLGEFLGASRCGYAEVDATNDALLVRADWTDDPSRPMTGRLAHCGLGPALQNCRGTAQLVEVDDPLSSILPLNNPPPAQDQSGVVFPLMTDGRSTAALYVFRKARIAWNQQYRDLVKEVALQIQAAVERSRTFAERERIIASLRASDERYRSLVEASAALVWEVPATGRISVPQAAWQEFTGQNFEEQKNWGWLDAVHEQDQDSVVETLGAAHDAHADFQLTYRLRDRSGEYRQVQAHAAAVKNQNGSLHGWIVAHRTASATHI